MPQAEREKGVLDLEVTRQCNLRCRHCFVGWSRDWTAQMPEAIARAVIADGEPFFLTLHICGGEPFVYGAINPLNGWALECGYEKVQINSNGTAISPTMVDQLAAFGPRLSLSVSIDGLAPHHDAIRGPGRHRQTSECLRALLAAGIGTGVKTVVTPEVLRELGPFLGALLREHPNIESVILFPVGVGPAGTQHPDLEVRPLSPAELRELALQVALMARGSFPVGIGAYPIVNPLLLQMKYPAGQLYRCLAGRGRVCVHADLSVSTCHPVRMPVYGTWREGLFGDLASFPLHAQLADRRYAGCADCEHKEICGHCRAFVMASGRDLCDNDFVCRAVLDPTV
jgi:radical SAM protein with 4Fe4S-binding SPASM domain